ncbi:hypothetical protein Vadar_029346 [Vaccinium darrowii]|uniref:Uncharacterized protein n=1 Tax=Vaccinium darrowii TaxID=229202 RepID=A0ACB7XLJ4_9ERIC|nr:hypothetical protein Vadar_029346 [Vaccinium darrowii]
METEVGSKAKRTKPDLRTRCEERRNSCEYQRCRLVKTDPRRVPMTRSAWSGHRTKQSQMLNITRGWTFAVKLVDEGVNCRTV